MPFKKLRKLDDKLTYFVYFNQKTYEYTHFREKKTVWLAWSTKRLLPALFIINLITFAATLYNALYVDKLFKYTPTLRSALPGFRCMRCGSGA